MRLLKTVMALIAGACIIAGCEVSPQQDGVVNQGVENKIPLSDPQIFVYNGYTSGLYPWGNDAGSGSYAETYTNVCEQLMPLDSEGNETHNGKTVILTLGGSNPEIIYNGILNAQENDPGFIANFIFINAAQSAAYIGSLLHPHGNYWNSVTEKLDSAGVTTLQVSIIFCIEDNQNNMDTTFDRAFQIRDDYLSLLPILRSKFPNCKLLYVGDRGYNGYTTSEVNKEPRGYLNGWAVKFLIEEYINETLPEYPVINWLDYYWANGTEPRWDGLTYFPSDFRGSELLHFTTEKANELGSKTHERLKADAGAMHWYY